MMVKDTNPGVTWPGSDSGSATKELHETANYFNSFALISSSVMGKIRVCIP